MARLSAIPGYPHFYINTEGPAFDRSLRLNPGGKLRPRHVLTGHGGYFINIYSDIIYRVIILTV